MAGTSHLPRQQDMLAGLGHGGPSGALTTRMAPSHLRRSGNHVLDVVGVAGAVHVSVVAGIGLVFHVLNGDG